MNAQPTTTVRTATSTRPVVVHATAKVTGPTLVAAAHAGTVRFAKVRESGTLRAWPVLAPGSAARKQAEGIQAKRAAKQPVEAIAKEMKVSVPTVRRAITALAFTLEVEKMSAKDRAALAKDLNAAAPKEQAPAKKATPAKAKDEKATPAKKEEKAPAKPKAPAKESNAARLARMKKEGKVAEKSTTES